ncbi:MAG: MFS transporter [Bifidobacteriaceae bacterium]|jgi:MFS family permease|nr:MFS transporter [Bifidobacteriaceae bacterium]
MDESTAPPPSLNNAGPAANRTSNLVIGGWATLWLMACAHMPKYAVFQGMQAILLPTQVANASTGDKVVGFGLVAALGALAAALVNPIAGRWSDRTRSHWGRRTPWLVGSSLLALVALLMLAGMPSVLGIGIAYFIVMAVMGTFEATLAAVLPDRVRPARLGLASAVVGGASSVGILIGVNLAARLVDQMWLAYGLLGLAMVLGTLVFVVVRPDPSRRGGPGILKHEDEAPAGPSDPAPAQSGFLSALRDHDFRWAFLARVTMMIGLFTAHTYLLYTLTDYIGADQLPGRDPTAASALIATINMSAALVAMVVFGPLSDRLGRRKVFVVGASLGGAAAAVIPLLSPTWPGMVALGVVGGLTYGCYVATDQAIMVAVLPSSRDHARDLGLLQIASTGPQVMGPVVAAALISLFGGYAALFAFCAIAYVAAGLAILPIRKVR